MFIKKLGAVVAGTAAGMLMLGGVASATGTGDDYYPPHSGDVEVDAQDQDEAYEQLGLVNLNNTNIPINVCHINVLAIEIEDALNNIAIPLLSPGAETEQGAATGEICASEGINQGNDDQKD
ncbi:hypothetical protein [Actinokineospora iranica]|uniref:Small secreted domain n=1 Tax=Actinokineospora iranica TaxID=1271860 RepID=A0A1G6XCA1_9PSEU|nr:hypothetical protein [Actinokineospora iranica]SDD75770.1 hypothetical protein SAMN05216174_11729 [Actinokineospora iranica]